jgi:hypothetical protein
MKCPAYPVSRLSSQHEASRIYSTSAANLTTSSVSKSAHGLQVHDARLCKFFPQTWAKAILKFHTVNIQWVLDDIYTHLHTAAVIVTPVHLEAKNEDRT